MSHPRSLAYHPNNRSHTSHNDRDYTPPNDQSRSGRGEKAARKRNSVACARCRKRKIKCTGDLGDGNGCEACQAAGTNQTTCFYLRVNSHQINEFPLQTTPEQEWPYSAATSAGFPAAVPRSTTDPGQYALTGGNMIPTSAGAPYPIQALGRAQAFDLANNPYAASISRQAFSMNLPLNLDSGSPQYGLQIPRQSMSLQLSQAPSNGYPAEYPPPWTSLTSHNRPLPSTYPYEAELPSSYQSTEIPYMPHGGLPYAPGVSESASIFPGLSPLASSLPLNEPSRNLPNPASVQSSAHGNGSSIVDNDAAMDPYHQQFTSRSSISSAARDAINASEGSNSTASSSPSDTPRSSNTGYGGRLYSSQVGSSASASSLPSGGLSRRVSNEVQEGYNAGYSSIRSGVQPSHSMNSHLPNSNTTYSIQHAHGSLGLQNDSISSMSTGGSHVSGIPPSIHHPQPQHLSTQDMPPILKGTFDLASRKPGGRSNSKSKGQKGQGKR